MFSALMLLILSTCLAAEQLDPQINVMNAGQVLDVRPMVSADRKYITFGGLSAGSSSLIRMRRADIITFHVLGLQGFHDGPEQMLAGDWSGRSESANKQTAPWSMHVSGKMVKAAFFKEIKEIRLTNFNKKKQQLTMSCYYPIPGTERKSAVTGQVKPPKKEAVYLQGKFSEDLHTFSGAYVHGKDRGSFKLEKKHIQLPKQVNGRWSVPVVITHRKSPGSDPYLFEMTFDAGRVKESKWSAVKSCSCIPMRWIPSRRELAMFVAYKMEKEDKYLTYGVLNGKFSKDWQQFDAHFYCPAYGSAHIQMQKDKTP